LLEEFRFDWELAGKAVRTVDDYIAALRLLFTESPEPDLAAAKGWVASTSCASIFMDEEFPRYFKQCEGRFLD